MSRNSRIKAKQAKQSQADGSVRRIPMKDAIIRDSQMRDTGGRAKVYAVHKLQVPNTIHTYIYTYIYQWVPYITKWVGTKKYMRCTEVGDNIHTQKIIF